jgi:hypothetical protein
MKVNWKVLVALVLIVGVTAWLVNSVRTRYYSGSIFNFAVGSGLVILTNEADEPVSAWLTGTGSRAFTVSSAREGIGGTSTQQGSGTGSTQLFEFAIPSGISQFTVNQGVNVNFMTDTHAGLTASVDPLSHSEMQTIGIGAIIVIFGGLLYIYRTLNQDQQNALRLQEMTN